MNITPINQDNTNFKALHVSEQSLKAMNTTRKKLLKNPMIKLAADKFEVLVKPSKKYYNYGDANKIYYKILAQVTGYATAAGALCGAISSYFMHSWIPLILVPVASGIFAFVREYGDGATEELAEEKARKQKSSKILVQCGERFEDGKLSGLKGKIYEANRPTDEIPNISALLSKKIYETKYGSLDADNLFTADKYLAMLESYTPVVENFEKSINDKGDTLLTQFFDVVPDEDGTAYKQIINTLKNIEGLNFNQKGSGNISCLEKIMNSENKEVLPLVKDFEFDYTPELEYAFANIQNKEFKQEILKLNIRFKDILEAVKLKSDKALKTLEPQLDSPLCNREKLAKDIDVILKEMDDIHYANWFKSIYEKYMNTGKANLID